MAAKDPKSPPASSTSREEKVVNDVPVEEAPRYIPVKDLFAWRAHSRPFKRRSREYWVTIYSIAGLLGFVLFLAEGVMPLILIISIVFLHYVMSTVSPEEIEYKITNMGVKIGENTTFWDEMTRFWFTKRTDYDLLVFETFKFPGKLEIVVHEKDKEKIKETLLRYVPEDEPAETSVDKAVNWVSKKLPQS